MPEIEDLQKLELERRCDECNGTGIEFTEGGRRWCGYCGGAGFQPTEIGEKILSLMRHNFKPMLHDINGHS